MKYDSFKSDRLKLAIFFRFSAGGRGVQITHGDVTDNYYFHVYAKQAIDYCI